MSQTPQKILIIFGTRPEAIKLSPLIKKFYELPNHFDTKVCVTAQHRELLDQVLEFFQIQPDYDLDVMKPNQDLFSMTNRILIALKKIFTELHPHFVVVQGDTTTAFVGALASFYTKTKIIHVEAGLRSQNKYSPYPEEINRTLVAHMAHYHMTPTKKSRDNLQKEGIVKDVYIVGNTVIDALLLAQKIICKSHEENYRNFFKFVDFDKKIILVTAHRRESFGKPFKNICNAIKSLADQYDEIEFIYPIHWNPNVQTPVKQILKNHLRIHLIDPLDYPHLIWIMNQCYFVLTDSGGIQEEAPSLGKPILVMRDTTERVEGVQAGTAKLVGTSYSNIFNTARELIENSHKYQEMARATNPYGDGTSSQKIIDILLAEN